MPSDESSEGSTGIDSGMDGQVVEARGLVTYRVHGKVPAEAFKDGEATIGDLVEVIEEEPVGKEPLKPVPAEHADDLEPNDRCPECTGPVVVECEDPLEEYCLECDYYRAEGAKGEIRE